jgi:DNA invertase Pin-like site-specific DNA recombinase
MKRMVDAFAEYERLIIGARTKAALQVKKQKGQRVGYVPYGYMLCMDNVHIMYNEREQFILKKISELRTLGMPLRKVAMQLNSELLFNRQGSFWNHVSVSRVMK